MKNDTKSEPIGHGLKTNSSALDLYKHWPLFTWSSRSQGKAQTLCRLTVSKYYNSVLSELAPIPIFFCFNNPMFHLSKKMNGGPLNPPYLKAPDAVSK
jgi:hypothetical protein